MAGVTETPVWANDVYLLETTDPVLGGAPNEATGDGLSNLPHQHLANRTSWLKAAVEAVQAQICPTGAIMDFLRSSPPTGWLELNGQELSRTTYADLFAALGTLAGTGNGSTTFTLPDYRGEFRRGWDHGRGVDAGRTLGSWQDHQIEDHTHDFLDPLVSDENTVNHGPDKNDDGTTYSVTGQVTSTSANVGAETRPRNMAVLVCIKS